MNQPDKMYVIVRSDLAVGDQAVQACHAALAFVEEHGVEHGLWRASSGHLVLLQAPNEEILTAIYEKALKARVMVSGFREPDLGGSLTALALEPGAASRKICSSLKLALSASAIERHVSMGGG